jgi:hypothetical protein
MNTVSQPGDEAVHREAVAPVDVDDAERCKDLAALLAVSDPGLARELARHALVLAPEDAEARALVDGLG